MPDRVKGIVFALAGVILLVGAFYNAQSTVAFLRNASRASGSVSDTTFGGSHPQIAFQTESGQTISYPQGGWIGGYKPGDAVTVLYSAEDPRHTATIDATGAVWFWTIFSGLLGTVFLLTPVFVKLGWGYWR